jgi:hypothetical protein
MLTNGCPGEHLVGLHPLDLSVEMLRVLLTLAQMDRHYRVRRQVLHEPLSEADAAHFLVFHRGAVQECVGEIIICVREPQHVAHGALHNYNI